MAVRSPRAGWVVVDPEGGVGSLGLDEADEPACLLSLYKTAVYND